MKKIKWINLFLILSCNLLHAEIEEIRVFWNADKCDKMCISQIQQNFKAIKEARDVQINEASGSAVMKWNPTFSFSYEIFRYAAAAVGIHIDQIHLKVKGKIKKEGDTFYLLSRENNTCFTLIGPVHKEPARYAPHNPISHPLTKELIAQLNEAEKRNIDLLISGPLFLPSHSNRFLIIEDIKTRE